MIGRLSRTGLRLINKNIDTENNIEAKVKLLFPEFEITEEMKGLPTVIFSFLTSYLIQSIHNKKQDLIDRFAGFVDKLSVEKEPLIVACLNEIFIGLYDSTEADYREFQNKLSEHASDSFQKTIELWKSQGSV